MKMQMQSLTDSQTPRRYIGNNSSLLTKYDIPITHLDFSYVETCEDRRELERILEILKSGEEGYYVELMRAVEDKLKILHPKSKFLRNTSRVLSKDELESREWNDISTDLSEWIIDISEDNKELEINKGKKIPKPIEMRKVRECEVAVEEKKTKPQKIKSTDYASWDKYDVDAELLSMDLKEDKLKEIAKKQCSSETKKKRVKFNIPSTEVENKLEAKEEREKGNEYFRAGDYNSALIHYSASVDCIPTTEALNNRAMTYLKLERYESAIKDCDSALCLDPVNLKANWRKSMASYHLGDYQTALKCIEMCVDIEPNNEEIQNFANCVRKKCKETHLVKRRMQIKDVTETEVNSDTSNSVTE
ncbi:sperm-associated antigen 1 [Coccinella septempunctata]|uniref:sperm-associated antigen 1 n=1 Tax=Coccinella septempunctata TaxID=41139 RepID=UPI001D0920B2|nr:sperm-associated antigen 1 [Coccinella septempunctata]